MTRTTRFSYRPQQRKLAAILRRALTKTPIPWLVEAGTGIGKSVAALAEALARSNADDSRVIIAVPTIQLQHQYLLNYDKFFKRPPYPSLQLVQGLSHYICLRRAGQLHLVDAIRAHTQTHPDGLLVHLPPPLDTRTEELGITYGECKGAQCQDYNDCFYFQAKRRGATAKTVLTNHSVILAQIRPSIATSNRDPDAIPSLLHDKPYLLIDEAHALENQTERILTQELTPDRLRHHINALTKAISILPRALKRTLKPLQEQIDTYEHALLTLLGSNPSHLPSVAELALANARAHPLILALKRSSANATTASDSGVYSDQALTALERFAGKLIEAADSLSTFIAPPAPKNTNIFLKRSVRSVTIVARPHHVDRFLETRLWPRIKGPILLSATLTTNTNPISAFNHTLITLGLWKATAFQTHVFPTPWTPNVTIWEPDPHYPAIRNPSHPEDPPSSAWFLATACVIAKAARQIGNVLVLCSSYDMVRQIGTHLQPLLPPTRTLILHNGASNTHTVEAEFRQDNGLAVMLTASPAFRSGADFPGLLLTQLVICRLPFEVPIPGVTMRAREINRAIIHFRQAIGRLIRTEKDTGEIYILDTRIGQPQWRSCFYGGTDYRFLWPTVGNNVQIKKIPSAWWQNALQSTQIGSRSKSTKATNRAKPIKHQRARYTRIPHHQRKTTP